MRGEYVCKEGKREGVLRMHMIVGKRYNEISIGNLKVCM